MRRSPVARSIVLGIGLTTSLAVLSGRPHARAEQPSPAPVNFGFPVGFSPEKMDPSADPRRDFRRYAAGRWMDAARLPGDAFRVAGLEQLGQRVQRQLQAILEEAARMSATAPKGSPLQQVGDFYASGMDDKRLTALGVSPLKPELDRIAAIDGKRALSEQLAHLQEITYEATVVHLTVSSDTQDRTRYAIYALDGKLPLGREEYLKPEAAPIRAAHAKRIAADLARAGSIPEEAAQAAAAKILEIETRVARKKLSAVELLDPNKRFVKMPFAEVRTLLSSIDLDAYLRALKLPVPDEMIVGDREALRERNAILAEYPIADTKSYLRWELVRQTSGQLTPAFQQSALAFARVLYGEIQVPPRATLVSGNAATKMGHSLSRLYVEKHFPADTKKAVEDLVSRIRTEFRGRLERNGWLSAPTRAYAVEKLDKATIRVGYPARWIDYAPVEIRRDDYLGNVMRLNTFLFRRDLERLGKALQRDEFAEPGSTLPIDVNAAVDPSRNGIEIPAAFLQPPFYDAKADAAVNYCTIGAVIGHELTHGFDSKGRLYDAAGNVRDWWTAEDSASFLSRAQKLVAQADAFEVLPGLPLNGKLTVGENLADVGGVAFALSALRGYLKDHPEANPKRDGFTPEQRCFLAWGQLWVDKTNEGFLKQTVATDPHANGVYRMAAPAQHEKAFYEAFGIRPGDPMWLDEKDRAVIW